MFYILKIWSNFPWDLQSVLQTVFLFINVIAQNRNLLYVHVSLANLSFVFKHNSRTGLKAWSDNNHLITLHQLTALECNQHYPPFTANFTAVRSTKTLEKFCKISTDVWRLNKVVNFCIQQKKSTKPWTKLYLLFAWQKDGIKTRALKSHGVTLTLSTSRMNLNISSHSHSLSFSFALFTFPDWQ